LIHVSRNGLRQCDAPPEYGSYKTPCNRWKRWSGKGIFLWIFQALAVTDAIGRPIRMILTAGRISDCTGARTLVNDLPDDAERLVADRGYDADWLRKSLKEKRIVPCIPPRRNRVEPVDWDPGLYMQRHRIENFFGRLKDWRRIATRHDRCPEVFLSACLLAATVMFWL